MAKELTKAVAYLRTSSKTNVGPDKDSDKRQLAAIVRYAKSAGYEIVATFYDAAVSGADPVAGRPEFARMLAALLSNGARTIIVESPDRFTRDLAQQLLGHKLLADQGLTLIAASAPSHFTEDTPTAIMVRQILGSVSEFEKTTLVAKLKASRDRKKALTGKCGGRPSHMEKRPDVVALAKALRRKRPTRHSHPRPRKSASWSLLTITPAAFHPRRHMGDPSATPKSHSSRPAKPRLFLPAVSSLRGFRTRAPRPVPARLQRAGVRNPSVLRTSRVAIANAAGAMASGR